MDNLSRDRIEVDMIKFAGAAFKDLDNRLMALQLVTQGLTDSAMFTANGEVVQAAEVLFKKADSRRARQLSARHQSPRSTC